MFPKNNIALHKVRRFIVIFYLIGGLGFLLPFSRKLFIEIIPLAILLMTFLLAVYHRPYTFRTVLLFTVILIGGFFVEVIGTTSGQIFGQYHYGHGLGLQLFSTPLLIGVNWLFITYTSLSLVGRLKLRPGWELVVAPTVMVIYDLVLELVAPGFDMWSWQSGRVPVRNFAAWWMIGFVFVALFKAGRIETRHPLADLILVSQFLFFMVLAIFFSIIK